MYDIKIFLEKNGQFGARANLWKEKIYALWNSHFDLLQWLKEWIELSLESRNNVSEGSLRLSKFLNTDFHQYAPKI